MPGFNRLSVLELFIEKEDHNLSWVELTEFYNVINGTERETLLSDIIRELEDERIIQQLSPLLAWELIDVHEAIKERDRLI